LPAADREIPLALLMPKRQDVADAMAVPPNGEQSTRNEDREQNVFHVEGPFST
jgi:hypothetical protein